MPVKIPLPSKYDVLDSYDPVPPGMKKQATHRAANYWSYRIQYAAQNTFEWDRMNGAQIDWNEFEFAIRSAVREMLEWMEEK